MFLNENILTLSGLARIKFLEPFLQKINQNTNKINVLEIGCANGNFLAYIDGWMAVIQSITGIDLNPDLIDQARQKKFLHPCRLIAGDALRVLNKNDKYDVIFMFDVLEHLVDDELSLKNVCRFLTKNGSIIFSVPAHMWLWSYADELVGHCRRYSKADITFLLRKMECKEYTIYSMGLIPGLVMPLFMRHLKLAKQSLQYQKTKTIESSVNIIPSWYKKGYVFIKYLLPIFYVFDFVTRRTSIGSQFLVIAQWKSADGPSN